MQHVIYAVVCTEMHVYCTCMHCIELYATGHKSHAIRAQTARLPTWGRRVGGDARGEASPGADHPLLRLKITQNQPKSLKIARKSAYRRDGRSM